MPLLGEQPNILKMRSRRLKKAEIYVDSNRAPGVNSVDITESNMTTIEPTAAAYQATAGSFLDIDRDLYRTIHDDKRHELVDSFILPIRSGRAWKVPAGYLCRITIPEGPQVTVP